MRMRVASGACSRRIGRRKKPRNRSSQLSSKGSQRVRFAMSFAPISFTPLAADKQVLHGSKIGAGVSISRPFTNPWGRESEALLLRMQIVLRTARRQIAVDVSHKQEILERVRS